MLDQILESTRRRVMGLRPVAERLAVEAGAAPPVTSLAAALGRPGLQVIAEIKRRSPSAGDIDAGLDPATRAKQYAEGGASAISVLTEPDYFAGSLDDLRAVRDVVDIPILRKDFVIDELQVLEARAAGADAVLLIVAALDDDTLGRLLAATRDAGLEALVEAHDRLELDRANACGAEIIGINNRNLKTFVTDLGTAERLAGFVLAPTSVAESGVSSIEGAVRMAEAGYDAILVGEALVRSEDAAQLVAALRTAGAS